jgi:hypothetical protein
MGGFFVDGGMSGVVLRFTPAKCAGKRMQHEMPEIQAHHLLELVEMRDF